MPISITPIDPASVQTLKSQSADLVENMSDKQLYAALVALFWALNGDGGTIDTATLKDNAEAIASQMNDQELKAALVYSLWSSVSE